MTHLAQKELKALYLRIYAYLLDVLRDEKNRGHWMSEREIAQALGTKEFIARHKHDIKCLAKVGLVESRRSPSYEYQYRAIEVKE
jgi:hypothetical protein